MSNPQFMLLIACLIWVGACSDDFAPRKALGEYAAVGLALWAGIMALVLWIT